MSQPQSLTAESPAAATVQQPPPVHVRDPIIATTPPTSPVPVASLESSQSAPTTLLAEGQEEEGDPNTMAAPMEQSVTPLHMIGESPQWMYSPPQWIDCPFCVAQVYAASPYSASLGRKAPG
ncbi:hypothetical protein CGCSCA5_v009327 [Colletotrichum siamense]|nr:hypothetical protein CGCSCA5_v009327 [Colletotrichum siamense]